MYWNYRTEMKSDEEMFTVILVSGLQMIWNTVEKLCDCTFFLKTTSLLRTVDSSRESGNTSVQDPHHKNNPLSKYVRWENGKL